MRRACCAFGVLLFPLLLATPPAAGAAPETVPYPRGGGDVIYARAPEALPVRPMRAVGGKRDWTVDSVHLLTELDASCRTTNIALQKITPDSAVQCRDGHINGDGLLHFYMGTEGTVTASFRDGVVNGPARIAPSFGPKFDGTLRNNVAEGPGTITEQNGTRITGTFVNGAMVGKARMDFPDGSHADVVYQNGSIDGPTVMTFADGTRFEYTVQGESYVGRAAMRFADGSHVEYSYDTTHHYYGVGGDASDDAVYTPAHGRPIHGVVVPALPDLAHWTMPTYSDLARRLSESGVVTLSFVVGTDGTLSRVLIHESSGSPRLDDAVLAAAAGWRYSRAEILVHKPGTDHSTVYPIAVVAMVSLVFRVQQAPIVTGP